MKNIESMQEDNGWKNAILAERKSGVVQSEMIESLSFLQEDRNSSLILGDACMINSKYLLDNGFNSVVDVDSSPLLLDDEIVPVNDTRLNRVVLKFSEYEPADSRFDFIYGKSIAFNSKDTTPDLLYKLSNSLTENGVFSAVWAAEGDTFRSVFYTKEELEKLYNDAGLEIIKIIDTGIKENKGLIKKGDVHEIIIFAKKSN